ncbi:MAG: protease modulator HflC [Candidatus Dadabacteria bacterium]|nr:MAG: protease modulator HflC [Candidatus Dadabacteria bacterium]
MRGKSSYLWVIAIIVAITLKSALFIVSEGKQAVILQFGKPVGKPITEAGLHYKQPFIQSVRLMEKRILNWDGIPNEFPTKDKKLITVDTTARWRIKDALKLIQKVRDQRGAMSRLTTILDAATRNVISNYNLVEAVRNSNEIFERVAAKKAAIEKAKKEGRLNEADILGEEIFGEIEQVHVGREALSKKIVSLAKDSLKELGIELIDVQLRRISYHPSVEAKVYQRMISERMRIAKKIRSLGKGEQARIYGKTEQDHLRIKSEAYRKVQEILGEAESERTKIYAEAYGKDEDFFELYKTLESYKDAFRDDTKIILSSDSEFLKFLRGKLK